MSPSLQTPGSTASLRCVRSQSLALGRGSAPHCTRPAPRRALVGWRYPAGGNFGLFLLVSCEGFRPVVRPPGGGVFFGE
jgi:hypothetical protein